MGDDGSDAVRPVLCSVVRQSGGNGGTSVKAVVEWRGRTVVGVGHEGRDTAASAAEAVVHALCDLLGGGGPSVSLEWVNVQDVGRGAPVTASVIVMVTEPDGSSERFVGSAPVRVADPEEAAAKAVLAALNRRLTRV